MRIFVNYRRDDSSGIAGRLRDRLAQAFGRKNIFMDVVDIPPGVDFVSHLNKQVATCEVFLVVIGQNWLNAKTEDGDARLHSPEDFVAIEISAALTREIRVIPVLVDGARMPKARDLPEQLKQLAQRNAVELRHNHFDRDAEALIESVRKALPSKGATILRWQTAAGIAAVLVLIGSVVLAVTRISSTPPATTSQGQTTVSTPSTGTAVGPSTGSPAPQTSMQQTGAPVLTPPSVSASPSTDAPPPQGKKSTSDGATVVAPAIPSNSREQKTEARLTESERNMTSAMVASIQESLCVVKSGILDASTREAIRQAKIGGNLSGPSARPFTNTSGQITNMREIQIFLVSSRCNTDPKGTDRGYQTAFEKFAFADENAVKSLQQTLGICDPNLKGKETGIFDNATRAAIKRAKGKGVRLGMLSDPDPDTLTDKSYEFIARTCIY
jgi:hypothetical protein